ncbi:MAG: energy transducer TonB, partial [Candidatus Eremiobacteraeota bacterium]|nr:energy transducer TonB [Candidatus Eremiobacteraeota bacterium]
HMNVYGATGDHDMARAAMNDGTHWFNMAQTEPCGRQSIADDNLEISLQYIFDADTRRGVQIHQWEAYERQQQHAANVAAAWAKKHPSKWVLAHPGQTPNPYAAHPNQPARLVTAVGPDTPPLAQQQGISGTVQVEVSLDESGHVTNAAILSSPSPILNEAALTAARKSTFRPEIKNGKPVGGKYVFAVDFTTQ